MNDPIRVIIDARMLIGRFSGIGRFVTQIMEHLTRRPELRIFALCGFDGDANQRIPENINVITSSFRRRDRTADRRMWWEGRSLRSVIHKVQPDVYHATWNSGIPAWCPVPSVLTVHDLIPWDHPEQHFAMLRQRFAYRYSIRASVRRASMITCVSEYAKRQLCARLSADPAKVEMIPNGIDPMATHAIVTSPSTDPYVLYVGGYEQRKNLAGVFRTMRAYWEQSTEPLALRLTGERQSLRSEDRAIYESLPRKGAVHFLGCLDEADLCRHYIHARALLMLSRDEGFGLPVLEAMAHGCPVVAAACASLPEVVGEAAILVDADDFQAASHAIQTLHRSQEERQRYISLGRERASRFRWESTAAAFARTYTNTARRKTVPEDRRGTKLRSTLPA